MMNKRQKDKILNHEVALSLLKKGQFTKFKSLCKWINCIISEKGPTLRADYLGWSSTSLPSYDGLTKIVLQLVELI